MLENDRYNDLITSESHEDKLDQTNMDFSHTEGPPPHFTPTFSDRTRPVGNVGNWSEKSEIVGNCRKLSEIVGNCRKLSENVGNCRKRSENVGKVVGRNVGVKCGGDLNRNNKSGFV